LAGNKDTGHSVDLEKSYIDPNLRHIVNHHIIIIIIQDRLRNVCVLGLFLLNLPKNSIFFSRIAYSQFSLYFYQQLRYFVGGS